MEFPRQHTESQSETKVSLHTEKLLAVPTDSQFESFLKLRDQAQRLSTDDVLGLAPAFADKRTPEEIRAKKHDDAAAAFEWVAWALAVYGSAEAFMAAFLANAGKTIAMTTVLGVSVPWWWPIAAVGIVAFVTATLVRRFTKERLERIKNPQPAGAPIKQS